MDLVKQTRTEVDRYRSMDRLIPSPHNVVTIAALEVSLDTWVFFRSLHPLIVLHGIGRRKSCPKSSQSILPFYKVTSSFIGSFVGLTSICREGNYTQVRIAAFDGLFLTKWYSPQIMRYILAVMANDSSRVVRRHVARNACYSLAILVQMGEMKATAKDSETLLIEEDGNSQEKLKESKKSEMETMIKVLRKDREVGKNEVLREFLMPIALYVYLIVFDNVSLLTRL